MTGKPSGVPDRDAAPVDTAGDTPRVQPRHGDIWIAVDGMWARGWIMHWFRRDGGWNVCVEHMAGRWPTVVSYRYDPATIRRRDRTVTWPPSQ